MSKPKKIYRSVWWTLLALIVPAFLMNACGAVGELNLSPTETLPLTLTPFQPQADGPNSLFDAPAESLAVATITPMPTPAVIQNGGQPPALVVPPTPDVSGKTAYEINPLTGLPFPDPALAERRPIVVKIGNSPDYVRPQSGLSLADVAYEYYIEWGDTRFIAVFYSHDAEKVGPVRSGRFFDEHILRMYHAFLVYKYSDPREKAYFYSSDFVPFLTVPGYVGLNTCPPFFYAPAQDSYNNIFFNTAKMAGCVARRGDVDNLRQELRNGFFSDEPQPSDQAGARIYTDYSAYNYNYWEYDLATKRYFRYQESNDMIIKVHDTFKSQPRAYTPMYDASTGQPVTADNIVVLFVPHTFANQNEEEDQVYRIDPVDNGLAYVFRNGLAYPARWYRTDMDQALFLADEAGVPIYLQPGRTFYEVIGESSQFAHDGDTWFFTFQTP